MRDASQIPPPEADREELELWWGQVLEGTEVAGEIFEASLDGDAEASLATAARVEALAGPGNKFAADYGLTACVGMTNTEVAELDSQLEQLDP